MVSREEHCQAELTSVKSNPKMGAYQVQFRNCDSVSSGILDLSIRNRFRCVSCEPTTAALAESRKAAGRACGTARRADSHRQPSILLKLLAKPGELIAEGIELIAECFQVFSELGGGANTLSRFILDFGGI